MVVTSYRMDSLREHYSTYLRNSLLAALIIHFLIFYFTPAFEFKPYVFEFEKPPPPIELMDEIEIVEPPPSIEHPLVEMITSIGGRRVVQMPYGEELPRIC